MGGGLSVPPEILRQRLLACLMHGLFRIDGPSQVALHVQRWGRFAFDSIQRLKFDADVLFHVIRRDCLSWCSPWYLVIVMMILASFLS